MPRYRILDQQGLNYLTCTVVGWVDVFTRAAYRDIILESLASAANPRDYVCLRTYS